MLLMVNLNVAPVDGNKIQVAKEHGDFFKRFLQSIWECEEDYGCTEHREDDEDEVVFPFNVGESCWCNFKPDDVG